MLSQLAKQAGIYLELPMSVQGPIPVEFTGLTVTPYVNQAGRLAYSLKATGIRAPGRGRPGPEPREVAA